MGVVRREGKWALEKKQDGVYIITARDEPQAKVITDEYVPESDFSDERNDMMIEVIEVSDFDEAKEVFDDYRKGGGGGGFSLL
ncbi:MAG: hypothetical protein ABEJ83_04455 [Candidatus Nanohaloarchaea archaeon]